MRYATHTARALALLAVAALSAGCNGPTQPASADNDEADVASLAAEARSVDLTVADRVTMAATAGTRSLQASGDCAWDDVTTSLEACSVATGGASAFAACAVIVWQSFCEAISLYDFLNEISTPDGPFGGGGGGAW